MQVRGAEVGAAKRTVAYRPVSSVLTGISLPSIFSQPAERPQEQRRTASKKEQLFALFFRCLNHTFFSWKVFHGFQKGQVHSRKHKLSKNIFEDDQVPGHHPRALKRYALTLCTKKNSLFPVAKVEEDRVGRSVQNFLDLKISDAAGRRWCVSSRQAGDEGWLPTRFGEASVGSECTLSGC